MRGFGSASALSLTVFLMVFLLSHLYQSHNPNALSDINTILKATPYRAAEAKIWTAAQVVRGVAHLVGVEPRVWPRIEVASLAFGLFSNDLLTCLIVALLPLTIYKLLTRASPSCKVFRIMACAASLTAISLNAFTAYLVVVKVGSPALSFMVPELTALILASSIGLYGFTSSKTPQSFMKSYRGLLWRVIITCIPLLIFAAFAEASLILRIS